jgi:hypothetical protein
LSSVVWLGSRGRGEDGESPGRVPVHQHSPDVADGERWLTQAIRRWRELGSEGEMPVVEACELHWALGQLLVAEEEAEGGGQQGCPRQPNSGGGWQWGWLL